MFGTLRKIEELFYIIPVYVGKGSYGAAYLVTDKRDKKLMVLKEISLAGLSKKETEVALQEAKVCLCPWQFQNSPSPLF